MNAVQKLTIAQSLAQQILKDHLLRIEFQPKLARIHLELRNNVQIFIRYNDHEEYSYSILYSALELDRCRFDNHDDRWEIKSKPHHFHPRLDKRGYLSPFIGDPEKDLPDLFDFYLKGFLYNPKSRFS